MKKKKAYFVDVDIAGSGSNIEVVEALRTELEPTGIELRLQRKGLYGPGGGNPFVRLSSDDKPALDAWLLKNGYDTDVHVVTSYAAENRRRSRELTGRRAKSA